MARDTLGRSNGVSQWDVPSESGMGGEAWPPCGEAPARDG